MIHLNDNHIPSAIYYKKIFSELDIYKNLEHTCLYPISKKVSDCILSIPIHPYLDDIELEKIVNTITLFFKND